MGLKAAKPYTALRNQELSGPSGMRIWERKGRAFFFTHCLLSFYCVWGCSHFARWKKEETEKFNIHRKTSQFCFLC